MKLFSQPSIKPHQWAKHFARLAVIVLGWWSTNSVAQAVEVNTNYNFGLGDATPIDIVIAIINWALGILALIAVIIILWGGITWLLSQGAEDKIERAKLIIRNGVIGLAIVLAAWGIATYIINQLLEFTNATNQYTTPGNTPNYGDGSPFYVDHSNPADGDEEVTLCHIVAVTFSFPLNTPTVTDSSFKVTIPVDPATSLQDPISNPDGGLDDNSTCTENRQCLSGVCSNNECQGDQLSGNFDFSEGSYSAVFYPASDFEQNTEYHVELTTTIEGVDPETGAVYNIEASDAKRVFSFTTGTETDVIPPTVDVTSVTPSPSDGDTEICLNPTLQAGFSESLDPASPDDANIWLYQADANVDGVADDPSDAIDLGLIRLSSIGGYADDTIVTAPDAQLTENTEYGINLYSGDVDNDFAGAIFDTCGNPLSGDFDLSPEGHPTDDFVDPASSGLSQAFCSCISDAGTDTCSVAVGSNSCTLSDTTTCTLDATCATTSDDYVGFDYQWTWTTGTEPYCTPDITSIAPASVYYSEDQTVVGTTDSGDSDLVAITGTYLYPFYDVDFQNNISAAGMNCFDADHTASMSCYVDHVSSTYIRLRTPVASQTGRLSVDNGSGTDESEDTLTVTSPYVRALSPDSGPVGQFVTLSGKNFIDYDPTDTTSARGHVYLSYNGTTIEANVVCTDGWDDNEIIIEIPAGFTINDTPKIQVVTTAGRYSNQKLFTLTSGTPGPGICELHPSCSDTGEDYVTVEGEKFGTSPGRAYFQASDGSYSTLSIPASSWNIYNATYESDTIITSGTGQTEVDIYEFTTSNSNGISNGLTFNITCSIPPEVFEFNQCNFTDTVYLPNPRPNADYACTNNELEIAFTNNMDDSLVESSIVITKCNDGYDATGNSIEFDSTACVTAVAGGYDEEYLSNAYINGDGLGTINGSTDVDDNGTVGNPGDFYEGFIFTPTSRLEAGYYYQVVVPATVTNTDGAVMADDYIYHFRIRNDSADCVADYLTVSPMTQTVAQYDATDLCLDNYSYDNDNDGSEESYTYRAQPITSACFLIDSAGTYNWAITDSPSSVDTISFGVDATNDSSATGNKTDTTITAYNSVCVDGEQSSNMGIATVTATILNPNDGSDAASDSAYVTVDFGYCTSDDDCRTSSCTDTTCDTVTHHCTPDVTSLSPNNASGTADVGPGGCITVNGCYFGPDQDSGPTCACVSAADSTETCDVVEGANDCVLSNYVDTCTLGEVLCTLDTSCTSASTVPHYASDGGLESCTCTTATSTTCEVDPDDTTCVVRGSDICSSTITSATYDAGTSGQVYFGSSATGTLSDYPDSLICGDVWDNSQVVAQAPTTLTAGNYDITLNSYYYNDVDAAYLTDTYGSGTGETQCEVGSSLTPCLCLADPDEAAEGETTDLYGENLSLVWGDTNFKAQFSSGISWLNSTVTTVLNILTDSQALDVVVPSGAVTDSEGVRVSSDNYASNAIDFTVSCVSNYDCGTGCCSNGQCALASVCNTCESTSDCTYQGCESECVAGMCAPYISALSPDVGAVGQPVTVQGCHFGTYYDSSYDPSASQVTADTILAPLACIGSDGWNNIQAIVTMPDGIFSSATDTTAGVILRQVYEQADGTLTSQTSNSVTFTQDDSCSEVDLPVLCTITDAETGQSYGAYADSVTLEGENFSGSSDGYCSCSTTSLGDCQIPEDGVSTSCSVTETTVYYVNDNDLTEVCSTATSSVSIAYDSISTTECDFIDTTIPCSVLLDEASCSYDDTEVCTATSTCTSGDSGYTSLDGGVVFTDQVDADIDFTTTTGYIADTQYGTTVPTTAETGDVLAESTTQDDVSCRSNGIDFPITCASCSDCAVASDSLNCEPNYNDSGLSVCTSNTTDFCRNDTTSCCGTTSCVYDSAITDVTNADYDLGTCAPQPYVLLDDSSASYTSGTNPQPDATDICPNAVYTLEFNAAVITADDFNTNQNLADADGNIDATDDVALEDINFSDYIYLVKASNNDGDADWTEEAAVSILTSVTPAANQRTFTLTQGSVLELNTDYEIIIVANTQITGDHQTGIVSLADGVAVGCDDLGDTAAICATSGAIVIPFQTIADSPAGHFNAACGPSYVILDAEDEEFADVDYTMIAAGQTESMVATVYAAGSDEYPDDGEIDYNGDGTNNSDADSSGDGEIDADDDQAITPIAGTFDWTYGWETIFSSIEDLTADSCPVVGIISDGETGSCECSFEESCEIDKDDGSTSSTTDVFCTTTSGVQCTTDSPNGVCDTLDSTYGLLADDVTYGCTCTVEDSCTIEPDSTTPTSCEVAFNNDEDIASCTITDDTGAVLACDADNPNWSAGEFIEDTDTQIITAGTEESTDTVSVSITGDGSTTDGWSGILTGDCTSLSNCTENAHGERLIQLVFCDSSDYLSTYTNSTYHLSWAFCRGDDPQASDFLPDFDEIFERNSAQVTATYGTDVDFIYEVAFKDNTAISNDVSSNNNTIALRVYPNDLDGSNSTVADSVSPQLWYLLNSTNQDTAPDTTTLDDYEAVVVGNAEYTAIADLNDSGSTLTPYVVVLAYSEDPNVGTTDAMSALQEYLRFNTNSTLSTNCRLEKAKIARDTKRVNDLGTMSYWLSSYYINDSDGSGFDDFPSIATGSYIAGLTGSVWPSWDAILGATLGQSNMPTDPTNAYDDAATNCPYNPPDLALGESAADAQFTYYDESGTCWDPVLKNYYGPAGSYLYQYQYQDATCQTGVCSNDGSTCTEDSECSDEFGLYSNLEYSGGGTWQERTSTVAQFNPCVSYPDATGVADSIDDYATSCAAFNYLVTPDDTTFNSTYAGNF